ncbi:MAG: energy transducer TonB, partial [Candidatus Nitrotoga sp.]|nr:energy transducer TonB [Candidatus Nitrotoga sp.]
AQAKARTEAARLKAEQEAAQVRAANEATISFAAEEGPPQVQVGGYGPTNKAPSYPHMARRMGLQGKVVLNVEVLANGSCGQINVAQSSGHAALDNNALSAVKTWHFIPATQAGKAINKWHQVPIIFSLKDN